MEFNFNKQESKPETPKLIQADSFATLNFSRPELPVNKEDKKEGWVTWGANNLYPDELIEYLNTSAIHAAIIQSKAKMQAGKEILLNGASSKVESTAFLMGLPIEKRIAIKRLLEAPNSNQTLEDIVSLITLDYQVFGAYALEIIWNADFTRIATIKHVPVKNIRPGIMIEDEINHFYYSRNWADRRKNKPECIPAFDPNSAMCYKGAIDRGEVYDKHCQILYTKYSRSNKEYFGEPTYQSALAYIKIDSQIGLFHLSNIENGFNPSMTLKFYKVPGSPEEKQMVVNAIKSQFQGVRGTGKAMIFFSDGKDQAPDIEPISVQNLDKQFMVLAEQVVQQIISGHNVTSPMLLGIATPGKLGYTQELPTAYAIFDSTVIAPERARVERTLNQIFKASGLGEVKITLDPFNPLTASLPVNEKTGKEVLAQTLGVGGTQSLLSILTDAVLTPEQKVNVLGALFGIAESEARKMLGL